MLFLASGMIDAFYGFLGGVLTGLGIITIGLLVYIKWDYKKFSAKLHGE